jgi:hypothetical protein
MENESRGETTVSTYKEILMRRNRKEIIVPNLSCNSIVLISAFSLLISYKSLKHCKRLYQL